MKKVAEFNKEIIRKFKGDSGRIKSGYNNKRQRSNVYPFYPLLKTVSEITREKFKYFKKYFSRAVFPPNAPPIVSKITPKRLIF